MRGAVKGCRIAIRGHSRGVRKLGPAKLAHIAQEVVFHFWANLISYDSLNDIPMTVVCAFRAASALK